MMQVTTETLPPPPPPPTLFHSTIARKANNITLLERTVHHLPTTLRLPHSPSPHLIPLVLYRTPAQSLQASLFY